MLQHIIRHSFAEREAGSWLPTETAQTQSRSQQLSPEKAECPLPRVESAARRTPQRSQGPEPTPSRGERCATGRPVVEACRRCAFSDAWRWQDIDAMRSRALADGKMPAKCVPPAFDGDKVLARCVPGRQSVAIFSLHASRKWPRTGKSPVRGKIFAPCIRNELALARYARHASEKPRKPPLEDTPREYLARKGPFSLHGPPESCIVRRSCHRSAHERKGSGRKCLRFVKN